MCLKYFLLLVLKLTDYSEHVYIRVIVFLIAIKTV